MCHQEQLNGAWQRPPLQQEQPELQRNGGKTAMGHIYTKSRFSDRLLGHTGRIELQRQTVPFCTRLWTILPFHRSNPFVPVAYPWTLLQEIRAYPVCKETTDGHRSLSPLLSVCIGVHRWFHRGEFFRPERSLSASLPAPSRAPPSHLRAVCRRSSRRCRPWSSRRSSSFPGKAACASPPLCPARWPARRGPGPCWG